MSSRIRLSSTFLIFAGIGLSAVAEEPKPESVPARVLPGLRKDGFVQLPNQWKLKPAGTQIEVGDLPVNIQLHPSGQYAAVLHSGMKQHEIVILDTNAASPGIVSRTVVKQAFYGLAFSPDGKQVFASGGEFDVVHVWDFDKGTLHNAGTLTVSVGRRTVPAGMAFDAAGRDLFVTGLWADCPTTTRPEPASASRRRPPWSPRTTWPSACSSKALPTRSSGRKPQSS